MRSYYVDDILPKNKSNIKYIFIFESPHKTEIETKIPVSGVTGKYILNKIGLRNENFSSFGEYILNKQKAAILNISNCPLQKINSDQRTMCELKKLDFIRKNYKALLNHRNSSMNKMENELIKHLNNRLNIICNYNNKVSIVVCGKFAETYFQKAMPNTKYTYMPHPSRNGWANLCDYQEKLLLELKNELS